MIYEEMSTILLHFYTPHHGVGTSRTHFKSEAAAKAALTRYKKKHPQDRKVYIITDTEKFSKIERIVKRKNHITGKTYEESVNTPDHCSPSSEAYWSM